MSLSKASCVAVSIWKVQKGTCGTYFLSLITGVLNVWGPFHPSSACTFGTKHWVEGQFPPVLQPHVLPSNQLGARHACAYQEESRPTAHPHRARRLVERIRQVQRSESYEGQNKVGVRKYYRHFRRKGPQTLCKCIEKRLETSRWWDIRWFLPSLYLCVFSNLMNVLLESRNNVNLKNSLGEKKSERVRKGSM